MTMELLVASAIAVLTAAGVYLVLRGRTFPVVLGLAFLSYAINLFLFAMGRLVINRPPIYDKAAEAYTDPLPQALVLTAIVIGFGLLAFALALVMRAQTKLGTDDVDQLQGEGIDEA